MTTYDTTTATRATDEDLSINPFVALRAVFGMLLGVEDLQHLMGNPRGKVMLHNSWLHGSGVVWGYEVSRDGSTLAIGPGLAIDGIGRELYLERSCCLDLDKWVDKNHSSAAWEAEVGADKDDCGDDAGNDEDAVKEVSAVVVASFATCLAKPVPALASPCDADRRTTEESRYVETARLDLVLESRPPVGPGVPFHGLRVFLGLDEVGHDDPRGRLARRWAEQVASSPAEERRDEAWSALRKLATLDVIDRRPTPEPGDEPTSHDDMARRGLFPVSSVDAPVVLATVCLSVRKTNGAYELVDFRLDPAVRKVLLPTLTIQELLAHVGVELFGPRPVDAGGPRIVADSVRWTSSRHLQFRVDRSLYGPSIARGCVRVTSLSGHGWAEERHSVRYSDETRIVVVELERDPAAPHVRVVVRGTGPTPVVGDDYVPLGGLDTDPPATAHGRDAVLIKPWRDRR